MRRILPLLLCMAVTGNLFAQKADAGIYQEIITIPVVVHVLYNNTSQNISDVQVQSQIDALNKDYRGTNPDRDQLPSYFAGSSADCGIEFKLARIDPKGYATNGIVRKQTYIQMFGIDDRIKSSKIGGDEAWDRNKYLNIWVGNLAGGIAGYTSSQASSAEKDGVVIHYAAFGTTGTASAPFNLGRTATHEIGHWLNLIHIWGDTYCGDDLVDDTPKQRASNRGCPSGEKISCEPNGHGDMYMNFMDLTNDACMFMFTHGQRLRMRALFEKGASRYSLLSSPALGGTASTVLPIPAALPSPALAGSAGQVSIYPNPSTGEITVQRHGFENGVNSVFIIYNYTGQPLMSGALNSASVSINISSLSAGIYFIKERMTGAMVKFVKN